jgi:hypothetical protein
MVAEPHERAGQAEIPDELVEEGRLEGCVLLVTRRPVRSVDLKRPREARRAAEELLVEVIADAPDRLGD